MGAGWWRAGSQVFAVRLLGASASSLLCIPSLSWWATQGQEVKDGAASPWAELCWEVDEQFPLDKERQWTGPGDGAGGPAVPRVRQMLRGGQ